MVYQPYNSSGRMPTLQGLSAYIDTALAQKPEEVDIQLDSVRK
jgi:transcriptional regulator of heat shock response